MSHPGLLEALGGGQSRGMADTSSPARDLWPGIAFLIIAALGAYPGSQLIGLFGAGAALTTLGVRARKGRVLPPIVKHHRRSEMLSLFFAYRFTCIDDLREALYLFPLTRQGKGVFERKIRRKAKEHR